MIKHKLTPNQYFLLYHFKKGINPPLINVDAELIACKYGKWITPENKLTPKAESLLADTEAFFKKIKTKLSSEVLGADYMEYVKYYRMLFPAGISSFGYSYRSSPEELKDKFIWFFNRYPDFSWDLVIQATQYYAEICKEANYKGMSNAAYFIQKQDNNDKSMKSRLADICQDILDGLSTEQITSFYKISD